MAAPAAEAFDFGGGEGGFLGGDLVEQFLLVKLGEHLAAVDLIVDIVVERGDDAGGLGFNFNLKDGLDLAGCDDGTGDIAAGDLGDLGGIDDGGLAVNDHGGREDGHEDVCSGRVNLYCKSCRGCRRRDFFFGAMGSGYGASVRRLRGS